MPITPYLFFEGRAEEAIAFYKTAIGATAPVMMRNSDSPEPPPPGMMPPGSEQKIMHAELKIGDSTVLVSDGHCAGAAQFAGFGLSLPAHDEAEANRFFAALSDGGEVRMPVSKTFFSPAFGMVQDRFGVLWMVGVFEERP
ncbi:VOC family protein [Roseomonas sp. HJA6]|uniref:VOC family protein n=1 Tax=Roseomonas alba TaxID=2846776 RepID=A0ABS7A2Z5_9PROT|nr:VOC family protein [Neoroseomonas alba]MBW6396669.1 VOC family protein [Neoroseomonas alba]